PHGPDHGTGALGVAPEAKILPVRVGNGRSSDRAVEQGIEWAADHGADVISIAIGGPSEGYFQDAVDYALEQDVVVVASAGNTSDGSTEVEWPAAAQGVVAVSGTDRDDEFSDESVSGPETALAAPAEDIMSAGSGERGRYNTGTGTSDSTAIVSGVAALVRAKYPDLDAANVINRLIATADDKGPEGRDPEYGFGIVNPVKALTENVPEVSGNPLLPGASTAPTSVSPQAGEDSGPGPVGITLIFLGAAAVLAVLIAITIAAIRRRPHA
ncbi:MAG: S8 family serine peptidase, partial [Micromonosporaceae bacterium]